MIARVNMVSQNGERVKNDDMSGKISFVIINHPQLISYPALHVQWPSVTAFLDTDILMVWGFSDFLCDLNTDDFTSTIPFSPRNSFTDPI